MASAAPQLHTCNFPTITSASLLLKTKFWLNMLDVTGNLMLKSHLLPGMEMSGTCRRAV